MLENWKDILIFLAVTVTAGVLTAVAVQFALGKMNEKATLAARAEIHKIMVAAAQQQTATTPKPQFPPQVLDI